MAQYRIIKVLTGEPLSSWVDDRKHLDTHLAERPEGVQKELVQSSDDCPDYDPDTVYNLADLEFRYPDRIAMWEGQCGYIGDLDLGILQSDVDNYERFHEFERAAEAADADEQEQVDPLCKVCGSDATDFNLDYSEYWCHQCQREYDKYGEPLDQDNGEEEDD